MPSYRRAKGVVARNVAGELVLVCTASPTGTGAGAGARGAGDFFVLNEGGEVLWAELERGADLTTLARRLTEEFEVGAEQARADALAFVEAGCIYGVVVPVEE